MTGYSFEKGGDLEGPIDSVLDERHGNAESEEYPRDDGENVGKKGDEDMSHLNDIFG